MSQLLNNYVSKIAAAFNQNNRYEAHATCRPILEEMTQNKDILFDIIKANLSDISFLNRVRHYSTLSMIVSEHNNYSLLLNIFPPLPDCQTNLSFQSIHHHGSLILSTAAIFGPGYESILFKKEFTIDYQTGITQMEIEADYQNLLHNIMFIDAYQPHIVFYPPDFSATLALWSDFKKTPKDAFKSLGLVKKFKQPIVRMISLLGLSGTLGINKVNYFDFYVENNEIKAMKEREAYELQGSNDNFLQNIFCFMQKTGFSDILFLNNLYSNPAIPHTAKKYVAKLLNNETIPDLFYEGHLNVPKVNLRKEDVLAVMFKQTKN